MQYLYIQSVISAMDLIFFSLKFAPSTTRTDPIDPLRGCDIGSTSYSPGAGAEDGGKGGDGGDGQTENYQDDHDDEWWLLSEGFLG